jgi:hypothetical protein
MVLNKKSETLTNEKGCKNAFSLDRNFASLTLFITELHTNL